MKPFTYGLRCTAGPEIEPVTLAEAKAHLFINGSDADADITAKIEEARQDAEDECNGRAFITQTWTLTLDRFPWVTDPIYLPIPPCLLVEAVRFIDLDGVLKSLSPGLWVASPQSEPARITPKPGTTWPATDLLRPESVQVQFKAGYGDLGVNVPAPLRAAIKLILGDKWRNRGDEAKGAIPEGARRILTNYRAPDMLAGGFQRHRHFYDFPSSTLSPW
jgi:uncharacterized phiE125 gp8 family phage protein